MIALSKRIVTVRQKFLCAFPVWFTGPSPSSSALSMNIDHRPIYCLDCFACCRMSCDGLVSRLPFPTGFFHLAIAFDMDDLALVAHHFPALSSVYIWIPAIWLFIAKILVCWRNLQQLICTIYPPPPSHPCLDVSPLAFYVTYILPVLQLFFPLDRKIVDFQMAFHKLFALALISTSSASPSPVFHIPSDILPMIYSFLHYCVPQRSAF